MDSPIVPPAGQEKEIKEREEDRRRLIEALRMALSAFEHYPVRRCAYEKCGLWFEAKDPRKKFHASNCKKNAYNDAPGVKEKRKKNHTKYMKKYRKKEKQRIAAELARLAGKKKGTT